MSPRLRITRALALPVIMGGGLCAAAMATTLPGSPPRVAPPCSPDGVCLPRYETWGWYETRWRPFPGDVITGPPTPAAGAEGGPGAQLESLGGPQPPEATQEGQIGPERRRGAQGAAPDGAPAPDGVLPPIDEFQQPGGVLPEGAPDATPPTDPNAIPDPTDPFGAGLPKPPAWMVDNARVAPGPAMRAPQGVAPATALQDGPNLHGDDAPPALPAGLYNLLGSRGAARRWSPTAANAVALQQPARVHATPAPAVAPTAPSVMQASAALPLSIELINPAAAVTDPGAEGPQQAIYFEASDQPTGEPVALPLVLPAN